MPEKSAVIPPTVKLSGRDVNCGPLLKSNRTVAPLAGVLKAEMARITRMSFFIDVSPRRNS